MNALRIDLAQITANALYAKQLSDQAGYDLVGVLKAVQCHPQILVAITAAGVRQFAFSSVASVAAMSADKLPARDARLLLGPSAPNTAGQAVELFGKSIQSTRVAIEALGIAARDQKKPHKVLLAIRTLDEREGVDIYDDHAIDALVDAIIDNGLLFEGLACNLGCTQLEPLAPLFLARLVALRQRLAHKYDQDVALSLGGSFILPDLPLLDGPISVRVGELLLAGTEPAGRALATCKSAFHLEATIVEVTPDQHSGQQVLLDIGSGALERDSFWVTHTGATLISMSGEFMVLHTDWSPAPSVGDWVMIALGYDSLKRALTFPFLDWTYV